MKKVLIVYLSVTGTTEQMAQYVAEGVRIAGLEAEVKRISEITAEADLAGYDGYVVGCPTYHLDMPEPVKGLLSLAEKAGLEGRAGGAFSSRKHPTSDDRGDAASRVFEIMESRLNMRMTPLGPLDLMSDLAGGPEGRRACQDYGRSLGELLLDTSVA